jgi:hypothetical protein
MPKDITSPFTPGKPVSIDLFVGRQKELERLNMRLAAASSGRLEVLFLTGERGIGKSSLATFARVLGERQHQMVGVHTFLGGANSVDELVRRVFDHLLRDTVDQPWFSKISQLFGDRIKQIDLFGLTVEFGATPQDIQHLSRQFAPALRNVMQRLDNERKGVFLILDDINGLASSLEFANWLKSLVDEIATSQKPLSLCLMLVGTDDRRQSLIQLQPSLARIFDIIQIESWSPEETRQFFKRSFDRVGVSVEDPAMKLLVHYAGGLPMLAHEIGDAVFSADTDYVIDSRDAIGGVFIAADIVGRKHLEPQVFHAIRSQRYRTILRKICQHADISYSFSRASAVGHLSEAEKGVFDNFLKRMVRLGVLERDSEGGVGLYRFTNDLHHLYFTLESARALGGAGRSDEDEAETAGQ